MSRLKEDDSRRSSSAPRRSEHESARLIEAHEKVLNTTFSAEHKLAFATGGNEFDLVWTGLKEKMRAAYARISNLLAENAAVNGLRTAADVLALRRI